MKALRLVIVLIFLGSTGFVCAQNQTTAIVTAYPNLEAQAKEYGDAFVRDDVERLVELSSPKYIEIAGGKEKLIGAGKATRKQFEQNGIQLLSWTPIEGLQLVEESGSLYAVVSMAMRTKGRGYLFEDYDCLIAVSNDGGEHWTFVSSTCVRLKDAFPQVAEKLVLCPEKKPLRVAQP